MTRPIAAIVLSISLFAGVYAYTEFVSNIGRTPLEIKESFSDADYSVNVTRTCDLVGDAAYDEVALSIRYRKRDLISRKDHVPQSEVIKIPQLEDVTTTRNEIYVSANLKSSDDDWDEPDTDSDSDAWEETNDAQPAEKLNAIRIEVSLGDTVIADKTIWQEPGSNTIAGSISFEGQVTNTDHEHE